MLYSADFAKVVDAISFNTPAVAVAPEYVTIAFAAIKTSVGFAVIAYFYFTHDRFMVDMTAVV